MMKMKTWAVDVLLMMALAFVAYLLVGIFSPSTAKAEVFSLKWDVPNTRVDGSPLKVDELSHYTIKQVDDESGNETRIDDPTVTELVLDYPPGKYCFIITATDKRGLISSPSENKCVNLEGQPPSKMVLTIQIGIKLTQ